MNNKRTCLGTYFRGLRAWAWLEWIDLAEKFHILRASCSNVCLCTYTAGYKVQNWNEKLVRIVSWNLVLGSVWNESNQLFLDVITERRLHKNAESLFKN